MPLNTVLMPVRNGTDHLHRALSSTLRALPRDTELALFDDASDDDVPSVLAQLDDSRITYFRTEAQLGVGRALSRLMESTDSEFVYRMDADDICLPGRFRIQGVLLERGADVAFGPIVRFASGISAIRPGLPLPISAAAMPLHLLIHNPLCHPTMAARRDVLVAAGGYHDVRAEDHDLWLRALARGARLVRGALPVLAYRRHEGQLSTQSGFIPQAFSDPRLQESYHDFVTARFGIEPTWLAALWGLPSRTSTREAELESLRQLVADYQSGLSRLQRAVLGRTSRLLNER